MKRLEHLDELLDIEFSELNTYERESLELKAYDFSDKDIAIIYFALKHHISYLSTNGASLERITRCVELANVLREDTRNYLYRTLNNLRIDYVRDRWEELKNELEN